VTDARQLLGSLIGRPLQTVTGRENRILRLEANTVVVWTSRSPGGQPVPIPWIQDALDRIDRDREIEISVASVRYRSAFIGAVLRELPGAQVVPTSPPRIRIPPAVGGR
jgi:hypothetical protein